MKGDEERGKCMSISFMILRCVSKTYILRCKCMNISFTILRCGKELYVLLSKDVCVKFSFYVSNVAKRGESFVGDD